MLQLEECYQCLLVEEYASCAPVNYFFKLHVYYDQLYLPLKRQSRLQQTTNFAISFLVFDKNKVCYYVRIVCQQKILIKYHAFFVISKEQHNLKLSSATNYRWVNTGKSIFT